MDISWLKGVIATTITPFQANEEVDEKAFVKEVHHLLNSGVDGLSVGGSTGEGAVLSDEEAVRLCELAVREVNGKIPVVAGVIRNSTRDAVRTAMMVKETGVDGLMVTPIHYHVNVPSDEGNYEFYERIGEAAQLPIILYNVVPHNVITPKLLVKLSGIPQVAGIKQSGGDVHKLAEMVHRCGHDVVIMSAIDDLLYPTYLMGAKGSIVALSAIAPALCSQQWQAFAKGDYKTAWELHNRLLPICLAVQGPDFPGKVKEAIRLQGRSAGIARSPVQGPTEEESAAIRAALVYAGMLAE
ncbi:MAG: dihydrodipicolinate synthase family protein [Bacilli bacterium]